MKTAKSAAEPGQRRRGQEGALLPDHDDAPEGWPAREAGLQQLQRGDRDRIRHLESELRRKEKALAEAAALLVLQKKPARSGGKMTPDRRSGPSRQRRPSAPSQRHPPRGYGHA